MIVCIYISCYFILIAAARMCVFNSNKQTNKQTRCENVNINLSILHLTQI